MPDVYIVSIKEGYKAEEAAKLLKAEGFNVLKVLKALNTLIVEATDDIERLKSKDFVRAVEENRKIKLR